MSALDDIQQIVTSLASVASNAEQVDLLILGGGRGGLAMLEVLQQYDWINIHAVVDMTEHAVAFPAARQSGIHTSIDSTLTLEQFNGDIVIDVTGDKRMGKKIAPGLLLRRIDLISGKSAKLLFDLVTEQLRNEKTIHNQSTRLNLLDSMLNITMQLENRPPQADVINNSLIDLCAHIQAEKGLAVVFNHDRSGEITHAVGTDKPACNLLGCAAIQTACRNLNEHHRFKKLAQPINLHCSETTSVFNAILPIWHKDGLAGALLLDIPAILTREKRTSLNMASIHLNMAVKTLDQYEQLEKMAIFDGLTGAYNRHYFKQKIKKEVSRIRRNPTATLACGFIDIDDFKRVNDGYGHQVGDIALKEITHAILRSIRDYDICARYGGDEFVILLPGDALEMQISLEEIGMRILKHVNEIHIEQAADLTISVSIGMALLSAQTLDSETLLKMADHAVYQAKEAGKNCLHIYSDEQFIFNNGNK